MPFQITGLAAEPFATLEPLSQPELATRYARKLTAEVDGKYPCRISLEYAKKDETLFLVNHVHLDEATPYRASHAVFVRQRAQQASLSVNQVPNILSDQLLSIRAFSITHELVSAQVIECHTLAPAMEMILTQPLIDYVHIHYAAAGCFAARADRV